MLSVSRHSISLFVTVPSILVAHFMISSQTALYRLIKPFIKRFSFIKRIICRIGAKLLAVSFILIKMCSC
jgi:hypothetical protein